MTETGRPLYDCDEPCGCYAVGLGLRQGQGLLRELDSIESLPHTEGCACQPCVDVLADASAEAHSWSSNTRRAFVADWRDFTSWCLDSRCAGLSAAAADDGRYPENLVETEGKTIAKRLGGHPDDVAAGEGHVETVDQGLRETLEAGARPDQRCGCRVEGDGADESGPTRTRRPRPRPRRAP